jgi:hypothetical protein
MGLNMIKNEKLKIENGIKFSVASVQCSPYGREFEQKVAKVTKSGQGGDEGGQVSVQSVQRRAACSRTVCAAFSCLSGG